MQSHVVLLTCLCLHLALAASENADPSAATEIQSDSPRRGYVGDGQFCRYNQKELHTTIRSAAFAALTGLCNPTEAEQRFSALEDRLMRKLEDIEQLLNLVAQQRTDYDEAENEDYENYSSKSERGSRETSGASDAALTHYNQYRSEDRAGANRARHRTYKRYGSSHTRSQAAASQDGRQAGSSGERAPQSETTFARSRTDQQSQSATSQTTSGQGNAAATSRALEQSTSAGSQRSRAVQDSRGRSVSAQSARSSSSRSATGGEYHPADANLRRRTSGTYRNGTRFSSVSRENELEQRRPGDDILLEGYSYSEVPRGGYISEAASRASGSSDHDENHQYKVANRSEHSSGTRQVISRALGSRTNAGSASGNFVAYSPSYTRHEDSQRQYYNYGQERGSQPRRQGRRHRSGRRYRGQHATHTVSYVSDAQSALQSRFREVRTFNDTVYEMGGKRMYSYYWEVKDFDTMMETWEERHSLRSPSFYIYQGGYRMYIRVFPSRQGGNVYLHAGLTPGRYDSTLRWPFRLRLRLALLDHSTVPDDIASRLWDPAELCSGWNWRRPRHQSDNYECVGLGFPQELVRSRRYVLDGRILIKLDVFLEE